MIQVQQKVLGTRLKLKLETLINTIYFRVRWCDSFPYKAVYTSFIIHINNIIFEDNSRWWVFLYDDELMIHVKFPG